MKKNRLFILLIVLVLALTVLVGCDISKTYIPVRSVRVTDSTVELGLRETHKLSVTVLPLEAPQKVIYKSSNIEVATVSNKGVITAKGEGNAVITITADGGISTQVVVYVVKKVDPNAEVKVTGIDLSETEVSIKVGNSYQLVEEIKPSNATDKKVTWTSNNTSVATVSSSGMVRGIAVGTAVINAVTHDGEFKESCIVTVSNAEGGGSGTGDSKELAKPMVSLSRDNGKISLSWSAIANATGYAVFDLTNNKTIDTVLSTSVEITDSELIGKMSDGIFELAIKAIGGEVNKVTYTDSVSYNKYSVAKSFKEENAVSTTDLLILQSISDASKDVKISCTSNVVNIDLDKKSVTLKSLSITGANVTTVNIGRETLSPGSITADNFTIDTPLASVKQFVDLTILKKMNVTVSDHTYEVKNVLHVGPDPDGYASEINLIKGKASLGDLTLDYVDINVNKEASVEFGKVNAKGTQIDGKGSLHFTDELKLYQSHIVSKERAIFDGNVIRDTAESITSDISLSGSAEFNYVGANPIDLKNLFNTESSNVIIKLAKNVKVNMPVKLLGASISDTPVLIEATTSPTTFLFAQTTYSGGDVYRHLYQVDGNTIFDVQDLFKNDKSSQIKFVKASTTFTVPSTHTLKYIFVEKGGKMVINQDSGDLNSTQIVADGTIEIASDFTEAQPYNYQNEFIGNFSLSNNGWISIASDVHPQDLIDKSNGCYICWNGGKLFRGIEIPSTTKVIKSNSTYTATLPSGSTLVTVSSNAEIPSSVSLVIKGADLEIASDKKLDVKGSIKLDGGKKITSNLGSVIAYNNGKDLIENYLLKAYGKFEAGEDITSVTGYTIPKGTVLKSTDGTGHVNVEISNSNNDSVLTISKGYVNADKVVTLKMNAKVTGELNIAGKLVIDTGKKLDLNKGTLKATNVNVLKTNIENNGTIVVYNTSRDIINNYLFASFNKFEAGEDLTCVSGYTIPKGTVITTSDAGSEKTNIEFAHESNDKVLLISNGLIKEKEIVTMAMNSKVVSNGTLSIKGKVINNINKILDLAGTVTMADGSVLENNGTILIYQNDKSFVETKLMGLTNFGTLKFGENVTNYLNICNISKGTTIDNVTGSIKVTINSLPNEAQLIDLLKHTTFEKIKFIDEITLEGKVIPVAGKAKTILYKGDVEGETIAIGKNATFSASNVTQTDPS